MLRDKVEVNVYSGGMVNIAEGNSVIKSKQKNEEPINLKKEKNSDHNGYKKFEKNNNISIFISYSWADNSIADILDHKLQLYGYKIKRDIRDAEYSRSIIDFMKEIRKTDYSIIILSDNFLKSENCMREIFEFIKDDDYIERIIPVIYESAKDIWSSNKGITYTLYWKQREEKFREQLNQIEEESKCGYIEELKQISEIKNSIGKIIAIFRNMKMFDANDNMVDKIIEYISGNKENFTVENIESSTLVYLNKWSENLFINKNTDRKVTLGDIYLESLIPHYKVNGNYTIRTNLSDFLSQYIDLNAKQMLCILGDLGYGKDVFISWITNYFACSIDKILVYSSKSELKNIDWNNLKCQYDKTFDITDVLLEKLNLTFEKLNGKILILDAIDDVCRETELVSVINQLYQGMIKENAMQHFSLIITCRQKFIKGLDKINCDYIELQFWDNKQVEDFCVVFQSITKTNKSEKIISNLLNNGSTFNKKDLSVPFILYLAMHVEINEKTSIEDIYEQIFSLRNGIYDWAQNNIFVENYNEIKKIIFQITKEIAFWIFENNPSRVFICRKEYENICKLTFQKYNSEQLRLNQIMVDNIFLLTKYVEGIETDEIYFIHQSIYDYFVSEYIFSSMYKATFISNDDLASVLGKTLNQNILSASMREFLKMKIIGSELVNEFDTIFTVFQRMIQNGMTFYTRKCFKNAIQCEMNVFSNMLEIIHYWNRKYYKFDASIRIYLQCQNGANYEFPGGMGFCSINLKYVDLKNVNLWGISLRHLSLWGAELSQENIQNADLRNADLRGSNLNSLNLQGVDLQGAHLTGMDLRSTNLENADLKKACFSEEQVQYLEKKYDLKGILVLPKDSNVYISYEEYCKRRKGFYKD